MCGIHLNIPDEKVQDSVEGTEKLTNRSWSFRGLEGVRTCSLTHRMTGIHRLNYITKEISADPFRKQYNNRPGQNLCFRIPVKV